MKPHVNKHYCLASIKSTRTFAKVFANDTVIIFQNDKTKIGLGILMVGHMFKILQSINEPVSVADYDFSVGSKMKLIPSVYLIIDPANSNDSFRLGQLLIFIRPKYFVGTSSLTRMSDLQSIISNQQFAGALMKEDKIKPIFVLLVDRGPDENQKHMKNIIQYCNFFSAYNPVERSMASLSEKFASITLPIDNFESYLDSQEKVLDKDLALRNFEFAGNHLYDI
ncbi:23675_t:CDS:2 [Gigaspora margarita]|uniref:23675_t:CDS:1 n=1 Tax=Gigaspora margarita TaxID=4874 RepID=A0ABN7VLL1_GIGMA|nr:23675_t:CDS:2 [Gigaspora margarita]